jgi:hypothetical protein
MDEYPCPYHEECPEIPSEWKYELFVCVNIPLGKGLKWSSEEMPWDWWSKEENLQPGNIVLPHLLERNIWTLQLEGDFNLDDLNNLLNARSQSWPNIENLFVRCRAGRAVRPPTINSLVRIELWKPVETSLDLEQWYSFTNVQATGVPSSTSSGDLPHIILPTSLRCILNLTPNPSLDKISPLAARDDPTRTYRSLTVQIYNKKRISDSRHVLAALSKIPELARYMLQSQGQGCVYKVEFVQADVWATPTVQSSLGMIEDALNWGINKEIESLLVQQSKPAGWRRLSDAEKQEV